MKMVYFDNSATTPLCNEAKAAMAEAMECFGNPSSLHPVGQAAKEILEGARKEVLRSLGVRSLPETGELIFTASGSEADNLAILGTAFAKERRQGGRIISTDSEHPAVDNTLKALEQKGFDVVRVPTVGGVLDLDFYRKALDGKTFLVTMMTANNETGALYDLKTVFSLAKAKNPDIVTHTDAVQAYLKCRFTPQSVLADLVTVSAHKIHAPKGVGALYVSADARRRRDLSPIIFGGGQEAGFRPGTENIVGIAGFGAAAKVGYEHLSDDLSHLFDLSSYAEEKLGGLPVRINRPKGTRVPHILNLTLPDIRSETMLHELSKSGICISEGSACAAHAKQQSRALAAFGMPKEEIECSMRVSFGRYNKKEEIDLFCSALADALGRLVRIRR